MVGGKFCRLNKAWFRRTNLSTEVKQIMEKTFLARFEQLVLDNCEDELKSARFDREARHKAQSALEICQNEIDRAHDLLDNYGEKNPGQDLVVRITEYVKFLTQALIHDHKKQLYEEAGAISINEKEDERSHTMLDRLDVPRTIHVGSDEKPTILSVSDRIIELGQRIQGKK
jgi:hypothetical protein